MLPRRTLPDPSGHASRTNRSAIDTQEEEGHRCTAWSGSRRTGEPGER